VQYPSESMHFLSCRLREAEESYSLAKLRLVKCVMGKHSSLLLTKYKLASVMVASEQYEKAAELLREIVDNFGKHLLPTN